MIRTFVPYFGEEEIASVGELLRNPDIFGTAVKRFEDDLARYQRVPWVETAANATLGYMMILMHCGLKPGDEVIIPDYTFISAANVLELMGITPVFADISLETYCLDVHSVERHITPKTKAVVYVSSFGYIADFEVLESLCREKGLILIHDAASAFGTVYRGRTLAQLGDYVLFSFQYKKNLSSFEGGAVTGRDGRDYFSAIKNHGKIHDFDIPGFNFRLSDIHAAIGIEQLKKIDGHIARRQELFRRYESELKGMPTVYFPREEADIHYAYQEFVALFDRKEELTVYLKNEGIETVEPAMLIHQKKHYSDKYLLNDSAFPNSTTMQTKALGLPLYPQLSNDSVDRICTVIKRFYGVR